MIDIDFSVDDVIKGNEIHIDRLAADGVEKGSVSNRFGLGVVGEIAVEHPAILPPPIAHDPDFNKVERALGIDIFANQAEFIAYFFHKQGEVLVGIDEF